MALCVEQGRHGRIGHWRRMGVMTVLGNRLVEDVLGGAPNYERGKRAGNKVGRAMDVKAAGGQLATQLTDGVSPLMASRLIVLAPEEGISRDGQTQQAAVFEDAPHLAQRNHVVAHQLKDISRDDGVE